MQEQPHEQQTSHASWDDADLHLVLVLGALATGRTRILAPTATGPTIATARALLQLGVPTATDGNCWEILGRGTAGLAPPLRPIDLTGCGSGAGLLAGAIAGQPITVELVGEQSAASMAGLEHLQQMGLEVSSRGADGPVAKLRGSPALLPIDCGQSPLQGSTAAAILVAGLAAPGETTVTLQSKHHAAEIIRLLRTFGASLRAVPVAQGIMITVEGEIELEGSDVAPLAEPLEEKPGEYE